MTAPRSSSASTQAGYDDYMEVIANHSGGRFLPVRFDHSRHLRGDGVAVLVLAFVLNLLRMRWANEAEQRQLVHDEMWLRCPAGDMQEQLGMEEGRQKRAVDRLVEAGLLERDHRKGNVLWVRVDAEKLAALEGQKPGNAETVKCRIRSGEMHEPDPAKCKIPYSNNKLSNKPTNTPPPSADGACGAFGLSSSGSGEEVRSSPAGGLAAKLYEGLAAKGKLFRRKGDKTWPNWVRQFKELIDDVGGTKGLSREESAAEIAALIDDHLQHLDDQYQPQAYSAKAFHDDYFRIEKQRKRRAGGGGSYAATKSYARPEDDPDFLGTAPPGFDTPEYQAEQAAEMDRLAEERRREAKRAGRVVRIVRVDDERGRP